MPLIATPVQEAMRTALSECHDLLQRERDHLFEDFTVNGDPNSMTTDESEMIEEFDAVIAKASAALEAAQTGA